MQARETIEERLALVEEQLATLRGMSSRRPRSVRGGSPANRLSRAGFLRRAGAAVAGIAGVVLLEGHRTKDAYATTTDTDFVSIGFSGGGGTGFSTAAGANLATGGFFIGTGTGVRGQASGNLGTGVAAYGGTPNGNAVYAAGTGTGYGLYAQGGAANGNGVYAVGAGYGYGVLARGGPTSGAGLLAFGGSPDGGAILATGQGTGSGIGASGGSSSGWGVVATGGSPNGAGLQATGAGTGVGVEASGGSNSGYGVVANGGSPSGSAVLATGAGGGAGVLAAGGASNGSGIYASGNGTGFGIVAGCALGVGGQFSGGRAPITLLPATTAGPPTSGAHSSGDIWADSLGTLWICSVAGTPGTFVPLQQGGLNNAIFTAASTAQYTLANSDGVTWVDMDATSPTRLFLSVTPAFKCQAVISGNADLWTANAGYNQDLGIAITGPGYPTTAGQPEIWKESGGFAGTFSPNAAFVETVVPLAAGATYTIRLQWKTNKPASGVTIAAGAGPIAGKFSPTRLRVLLIASA